MKYRRSGTFAAPAGAIVQKSTIEMSFFSRLENGWRLAGLSLSTINKNRSMLLLPVFSGISLILVLATFFGGGYFLFGDRIESLSGEGGYDKLMTYSVLFLYYLINYFIIVFFNSALIHCAIKVLHGEETTLQEGLSFAWSRVDKILTWAVLSATVGTLLRALQNTGKIGEIVGALIGVAWSIMTFFVVPVLIYENRDVFASVKESGRLMREKWGESLAANVGFGLIQFLGVLVILVAGFLLAQVSLLLALLVGLLAFLLLLTVVGAARTVFVAATYNHVTGTPIGDFDGNLLDSAFITKK